MNKEKKSSEKNWLSSIGLWLITAIAALTILAVSYAYYYKFGNLSEDNAIWGQFGDYFGGTLNPILSFISVLLLVRTVFLQNEQIDMQREELKNSKTELTEQRELLVKQSFENTFFKLIEIHHSIVNAVVLRNLDSKQLSSQGRECFRSFHKELVTKLESEIKIENKTLNISEIIARSFHRLYLERGHKFDHYYRNLQKILEYIDTSNINNKNEYSSILSSQLSASELSLLFYYGLSYEGNNIKTYLEKYSLLKDLTKQNHSLWDFKVFLYEKNAYGSNGEKFYQEAKKNIAILTGNPTPNQQNP